MFELLAPLVGGLLQSGSASSASSAQAAGEAAKVAEQQRQYDLTRQDYAPYRQVGTSALASLASMLGLSAPQQMAGATTQVNPVNADAIRTSLLPQYTTKTWRSLGVGEGDAGTYATTVDEVGLNRAVNAELAKQQPVAPVAGVAGTQAATGSLLTPYTGASLMTDPGYKFGLDQGLESLANTRAARGGLYSGAAMKEANKYATDYAGTKFNEGFNRDLAQKNQTFNMLSGLAGTGQTATNQVASAGQNMANQVGNALSSAGDARASGYLAQGNIWGNALNQGVSAYNRQNAPQWNYGSSTPDYNFLSGGVY